jgi:1-aminocyclopropane-1-carboxylate deaminase
MTNENYLTDWLINLPEWPRARLAQLPTPIHRLKNFGIQLNGPELWIKRDDLTGLAGGGNKTRKLEFLAGDAIATGADMLVTVGAIQSNHTRQTAAAAACCGLKCALLHCSWTDDPGPGYRNVGNILLSSLLGAELYLDEKKRPIEDQGPLEELANYLREHGHKPYVIPGGASEHRLGSLGYMACAAEIVRQSSAMGITFDYVVHCTGSSSTQSGLVAGFAALGEKTHVIGIADDYETEIKKKRVLQLANDALQEIRLPTRVNMNDIEIIAGDKSPYGVADEQTYATINIFARTEGLIIDPVYEGKAIRGLLELAKQHRFEKDSKILIMHLGGTPAVHAYASQLEPVTFTKFSA